MKDKLPEVLPRDWWAAHSLPAVLLVAMHFAPMLISSQSIITLTIVTGLLTLFPVAIQAA